MIRSITVTNPQGESLTLELKRPDLSGFIVKPIEGLGPVDATINFSEYGSGDGAMYNSSRVSTRNIVLSLGFMEKPTIEATRHLSYKYFPNKKTVHLVIITDERTVATDGYVEKNIPDIFSSEEGCQISIVCPSANLVSLTNQVTNKIPAALVPNPSMSTDFSGYTASGGPGGVVSMTRQTIGGYVGKYFFRATVTAQATDTGPSVSCPIIPVTPGVTYTFSAWVRAAGNLAGRVTFYKNGLSNGYPVIGAGGTIGGAWVRRYVTFTAPPNVDSARLSMNFGGIGFYTPGVGSTIDVGSVLYEVASAPSNFSNWVGDSAAVRRNLFTFPSIASELALWTPNPGPSGVAAVTSVPNGGVQNGSYIRCTWSTAPLGGGTVAGLNAPGLFLAQIPCYYGDTYRVSAWVRPSATMTVLTEVAYYNAAGATVGEEFGAGVVCPGGVWTRVSMTCTPPALGVAMRMYYGTNGTTIQLAGGANLMEIDQMLCERSSIDGSYFENVNLSVSYAGEVDTGLILKILSLAPATNVTITNVKTGEFTKIDTTTWLRILGVDTWSLFHDGDVFTLNSLTGLKSALLDRSLYGLSANMMGSISRDSSWLKLTQGTNVFEIKADTGLDSLRFSVESPVVYEGV